MLISLGTSLSSHTVRHLAGAVVIAALAASATAEVRYEFTFNRAQIGAVPGGIVSVPLFLREIVTPPDSSLLVPQRGVSSVGVRLQRTSASGSAPARIAADGDILPNPDDFFGTSNPIFAPIVARTPAGNDASLLLFARREGVIGEAGGAGERLIRIATIRFTVGTAIGETTTFTTSDRSSLDDTVTWTDAITLDASVRPAQVQIIVVPPCTPDFNRDGTLDFFDYLDFIAAYDSDSPSADFNGDAQIDFFDYLDFIAAFELGC